MLETTLLATAERQVRRQRELTVDPAQARQASRRGATAPAQQRLRAGP